MSNYTADVIVIGSGISGASAAYYCQKRGLSAICLEETLIGDGQSSRNGGFVRQSGRGDWDYPLSTLAVDIWKGMKDELGVDPEYRQLGYLIYAFTEAQEKKLRDRIVMAAKYGVNMEYVKKEDIKKYNPYTSDMPVCAGYTDTDGVANPLKAPLAFYKRGREIGVRYFTDEKVIKLKTFKGRIRKVYGSSGNVYEADNVIVAAGTGSQNILKTIGIDMPALYSTQDVIVTEKAPHMFDHTVGAIDGFYGSQTVDGTFVFGHNHSYNRFRAPGLYNKSCQYNIAYVCDTIGQYFPALKKLKVMRSWNGVTDASPDGKPVLGEFSELPGLYTFMNSSGTSFCLGPGVGYVLAQMVAGEKPAVDVSALSPDRFTYSKDCLLPY